MEFSGCQADYDFGPAVQGCRGDFDFTLKFEYIFLSILPAAIFIPLFITSIAGLLGKPHVVRGAVFQWFKLIVAGIFAALQLALLALTSLQHGNLRPFLVAGSALSFVAALCICATSYISHACSPRPSTTLAVYFCLTVLFDITTVRTLWLASSTTSEQSYTNVFTASIVVKALLLVLEGIPKRRWLQWQSKEHSPEETASIYDLTAFWWLNSLFFAGYRKILKPDDLFALDRRLASETLQPLLAENLDQEYLKKHPKHGLLFIMVKTLTVPLLLPVAPRAAQIGFSFCQPFLIQTTLDWLQQPQSDTYHTNIGYGLIGATIITYTGLAISTGLFWYYHERSLWMARSALAGIIYRKTTFSRLSAADDSAAVTLMSTDVEKIRFGFILIHEFWASAITVGIALWLLYVKLGPAFVAPIAIVIFSFLVGTFASRFAGPRQKAWMEKIQKRVGLTGNVIANMKHLKISGLTSAVEAAVQKLRVDEIKTGNRFRTIQSITGVASFLPMIIGPVVTLAASARWLDVTTVFVSISFLTLLSDPAIAVIQTVPSVMGALACLTRVQTFLMKEQREDTREDAQRSVYEKSQTDNDLQPDLGMKIVNGSFGWTEDKTILKDINITIPGRQLTMVVGPVASGKSTLCTVLLGEIPHSAGKVILGSPSLRRMGYCDQTSFLYNKTVRENIVGFAAFDKKRYDQVIDATMLQPDLALLPQGDETNIGSNGITLSGGQKQRVSMARALYLNTDIFVFDDILSGLDAETEEHVWHRVFGPQGLIKKRHATAVLCTHAIRRLPSADHIIALSPEGTVVEEGTFADVVAKKQYVHSLNLKVYEEEQLDELALEKQDTTKSSTSQPSKGMPPQPAKKMIGPTIVDKSRQLGDMKVFSHFFSTFKLPWLVLFFVASGCWGAFMNIMNIWLKFWSADAVAAHPSHSWAYYVGIYSLLSGISLLGFSISLGVALTKMITQSGGELHKRALYTVIRAPLRFFTTTDVGQVTNLFSQDMTIIDGELMLSLCNVSLVVLNVIGLAAVIATASPWLAISYPIIFAVVYGIQVFYLRTSRQIRLLDLEAKSPLYTNFIDTLKGLATVRAFGWTKASTEYNDELLDGSQKPAYLLAMIQRWLTFVVESLVAVLAIFVVTLATQLRRPDSAGFTGASLVSLMSMGPMLAFLIRMYTQLETSIGAVARLKTFSDSTKPEDQPGEDTVPDTSWPTKGAIEIRKVSASYGTSPDSGSASPGILALRDLNISIQPGEKVAICGRTGSGKSSTILLLLRLLDPLPSTSAESMIIDGLSLLQIDRSTLRRRIIAVPQDAVFLPDGTSFQINLDPYEAATANDCRYVLEAVDLWAFVEDRGGLNAGMVPDTLSAGQKQLFSIARAILRRRLRAREILTISSERDSENEKTATNGSREGGILLLDEVSSSVDHATERKMHDVIQREFEGYTIVMISHRLDVVMDFDRVIVMDSGSVVESGPPRELAQTEGGRFRDLWLVGGQQ